MGKKGINLENLINYLKILKTGMSHRRNRTPTRNWFLLRSPFPSSLLQETRLCPAVPIESQASSTPSHDHSPSRRLMKCKEAGDQGSRSIGSLSAGLGSRSGTICPGTLSSASLLSEGGATPSSASGSVGFSAGTAALLPDPDRQCVL